MELIDWHDAVVVAIIQDATKKPWLACLVASSLESEKKLYILFPLLVSEYEDFKELLGQEKSPKKFKSLQSLISKTAKQANAASILQSAEIPDVGSQIKTQKVTDGRIEAVWKTGKFSFDLALDDKKRQALIA